MITLAPAGSAPRLQAREVWPDPLSVMVARDHPLAGRERVSILELAAHPAVLPGPGTYTGQILQQLFDASGVRLEVSMETNYSEISCACWPPSASAGRCCRTACAPRNS